MLKEASFQPNIFSLIFNPFHIARKGIFCALNTFAPNLYGHLLDIGCGGKPYEKLFCNASSYIGLDLDQPRNRARKIADHYYDGNRFPYDNETFNAILCSQVLEHVFEPDQFIKEVHRVLEPNGQLLLSVPFLWDEHEQPWDYARYTSFALKYLFEKHGFEIIEQKKLGTGITAIIQLFTGFLYKKLTFVAQYKIGKIILGLTIFFPLNILAVISEYIPSKNNNLYLDNVIFAKKL